jgi:hypothetical protein
MVNNFIAIALSDIAICANDLQPSTVKSVG